jgi:hypothetical protein
LRDFSQNPRKCGVKTQKAVAIRHVLYYSRDEERFKIRLAVFVGLGKFISELFPRMTLRLEGVVF